MRAERSTDRDSQYVSLASSDALLTAGWKRQSPRRNSYDNALGETVNGLYKATLIYSKRICEPASELELATLNWVHWWNTSRLYEALGYRSPTAVEAACTPPPATTAPATVSPRNTPRALQDRGQPPVVRGFSV